VAKQKTAVIYARFSSDLQRDQSIDDQVTLCEQIAKREGYKVVQVYSDRAKSGASMFERDGLLTLMQAAKRRSFDAVISESLDRLSRDQEDLAGIFKRLKYSEIKLISNEGEATDIHVGIRGIVGSMFLKDLGDKVRRHHSGRAREGKFAGAVTYGYRAIAGKPGEREIDADQAKIVRRIFTEFANGRSARKIAGDLTREGVPSPSGGKHWNHQTFVGGTKGRRGMIGNRLYVGQLVWNANRTVINPETGAKAQRRGNPDDLIVTSVPHLRIIDERLWDLAHGICDDRSAKIWNDKRRSTPRRGYKEHLLSGMLFCAACGGYMRIYQSNGRAGSRVACAEAIQKGTCTHRKSYYLAGLEDVVLHGMKQNLTNPQALIEFTRGYHARWAERQKELTSDRDASQKALNRIEVQIDRFVTAIGESDEPVKAMVDRLNKLEAERAALAEKVRLIENEGNIVTLHPAAMDTFARSIEALHLGLSGAGAGDPALVASYRAAFRNVFERFLVNPTPKRQRYEVTPYARLSAIMGFDPFPKGRSAEEMLAEQGVTMPFSAIQTTLNSQKQNTVIPLGRWSRAA
jgi:DNA invertase Pin-like site-specific DNA recombinase